MLRERPPPCDRIGGFPRALSVDHIGFEEANYYHPQRVVMSVTHRSRTGLQARVSQPFCIFDQQVPAALITVMDQVICG